MPKQVRSFSGPKPTHRQTMKTIIAKGQAKEQAQAYEQYLWDLEVIKLVAPSSLSREEFENCGFDSIDEEKMEAMEKRRRQELAEKKDAIQKYVEKKYQDPQERKRMYVWLCGVAEALSAEESIRLKKLWISATDPEADELMLSKEYANILAAWRKPWLDKVHFGTYKDEEINSADRDTILATFAYLETMFKANQIFRGYYDSNHKYEYAPLCTSPLPGEVMRTDANGIYFDRDSYAISADSWSRADIKSGHHSTIGAAIPSVAQSPAHEYGHVFDNAVATSIYARLPSDDRHNLEKAGGLALFQIYVSRKLRQIILKKAAKKLGWMPRSGVLAKEPGKDAEGISNYGTGKPSDFIAEVFAHAALTRPEERNALGQTMMDLFSDGPDSLADVLCKELQSDEWKREFLEHMEYFRAGYDGHEKIVDIDKIEQISPTMAKRLMSIMQSKNLTSFQKKNIRKAVFVEVTSILNNAMNEKDMRREMRKLSRSLHNLKIVIDNKWYYRIFNEEEKALKGNRFHSEATYKESIQEYAVLNMLDALKPENVEKLPTISKLQGIRHGGDTNQSGPQSTEYTLHALEDDKLIPCSPFKSQKQGHAKNYVPK